MKKILSYALLLGVFILNTGAGCDSKTKDPQPDNFQTLVGKWQLQGFENEITKQNGSVVTDAVDLKARGVVIIWEFFSDGRFIATQDGKSRETRWELKVNRLNGKNIDLGTLKIIGDQEREAAQLLGQSGDLTYNIETSDVGSTTGFAIMYLSVDATKAGDYQKNILTYTYHKL